MFDIGWQELALTGVVALVVLGPEELPGLLRTAGKLMRKARQIANEFRASLDELADEAELEEFRRNARKIAAEKQPLLEEDEEEVEETAKLTAQHVGQPAENPVAPVKAEEERKDV